MTKSKWHFDFEYSLKLENYHLTRLPNSPGIYLCPRFLHYFIELFWWFDSPCLINSCFQIENYSILQYRFLEPIFNKFLSRHFRSKLNRLTFRAILLHFQYLILKPFSWAPHWFSGPSQCRGAHCFNWHADRGMLTFYFLPPFWYFKLN